VAPLAGFHPLGISKQVPPSTRSRLYWIGWKMWMGQGLDGTTVHHHIDWKLCETLVLFCRPHLHPSLLLVAAGLLLLQQQSLVWMTKGRNRSWINGVTLQFSVNKARAKGIREDAGPFSPLPRVSRSVSVPFLHYIYYL
jgi:hypothetical protein